MVIYVKLTSQILKYEKISIFKNDLGIAYKLNIYKYDSVNKLTSELIEIDNLTITGNSLTLVRIENEEIEIKGKIIKIEFLKTHFSKKWLI